MTAQITTAEQVDGKFVSTFGNGSVPPSVTGEGQTLEESVRDLLYKHKLQIAKTEQEKIDLFLKEHYDEALKIALKFHEKLGMFRETKFSTIIKEFPEETEEHLRLQLNFLQQFGMANADKTAGRGKKWSFIIKPESLKGYYLEKLEEAKHVCVYFQEMIANLELSIKIGQDLPTTLPETEEKQTK